MFKLLIFKFMMAYYIRVGSDVLSGAIQLCINASTCMC